MAREVNKGQPAVRQDDEPRRVKRSNAQDNFDWSFYLSRNEKLLWQGKPSGGIKIGTQEILTSAFGLIFVCSGLFAMTMGLREIKGEGFMGIIIGIAHFSVGSYIAFGRYFTEASRLKNTHYAITDKRALIHYRNALNAIVISNQTTLEVQHHGDKTSIFFDQDEASLGASLNENINFSSSRKSHRRSRRTGFRNITDGKDVYDLLNEQITSDKSTQENNMEFLK